MINLGRRKSNPVVRFRVVVFGAVAACVLAVGTVGAPAGAQQYSTPSGPLVVSSTDIQAGDTVLVSGAGFAPVSPVQIVLVSDGPEDVPPKLKANPGGAILAQSSAGIETILLDTMSLSDGTLSAEVTFSGEFTGSGILIARGVTADGSVHLLIIDISNNVATSLPATGSGGSTPLFVWIGGCALATGGILLLVGRRLASRRTV
jgi:LPXTG-motif cell wall-anchored protein